jgi:Zn-dependent protease/CBS domain-containing protein
VGGSIRLGSVRGIPIRAHFSFLLILPFLALLFASVFRRAAAAAHVPAEALAGPAWAWGLGLAAALFASVLLHELAHSLYALAKGGAVADITLLMIGGVSRITRMPGGKRQEAMMAFVGPLTSLVLGGLFLGLHRALLGDAQWNLQFGVFYLGALNVILGVFNLLPAFPMDGGRIVRSLLEPRMGRVRATRTAATIGKGFAVLFGLLGLLSFNLLLLVIAFFVWVGAKGESQQVVLQEALGRRKARDLMSRRVETIPAGASVEEAASLMREGRHPELVVADEAGTPVGVLTIAALRQLPAERREVARARDLAFAAAPVDADDEAWSAVQALGEQSLPLVPVVEGGVLVGVISQRDVMEAVQLYGLEDRRGRDEPWDFGPRRREA